MNAQLVFDGSDAGVRIPPSMQAPLPDQMCGTHFDQLGELASRTCYDSFGLFPDGKRKGRPSAALHEHILQVKNHSVYEHANFTTVIETKDSNLMAEIIRACCNRKGLWLEMGDGIEITTNLRVLLEWERHTKRFNETDITGQLGETLRHYGNWLAPAIIKSPEGRPLSVKSRHKAENLTDDQAWISLWLYGSRGFTHEMVRHRFAMSQRSTRYVDESDSPYILHPLISKWMDSQTGRWGRMYIMERIDQSMKADRKTYDFLVDELQAYLIQHGMDKVTARKQARGASRGYLGNALASEMIYSSSVAGWKWILSQRKNKLADAEIREVFSPGLAALKSSCYGERFAKYETVPSPDGMGTVLAA